MQLWPMPTLVVSCDWPTKFLHRHSPVSVGWRRQSRGENWVATARYLCHTFCTGRQTDRQRIPGTDHTSRASHVGLCIELEQRTFVRHFFQSIPSTIRLSSEHLLNDKRSDKSEFLVKCSSHKWLSISFSQQSVLSRCPVPVQSKDLGFHFSPGLWNTWRAR